MDPAVNAQNVYMQQQTTSSDLTSPMLVDSASQAKIQGNVTPAPGQDEDGGIFDRLKRTLEGMGTRTEKTMSKSLGGPAAASARRPALGSEPNSARPRREGFRPPARREERGDLTDHERRVTTPAAERPASLRVAAKMAAGFVERLDRIADTLFAFLLPGRPFSRATRLVRNWVRTLGAPPYPGFPGGLPSCLPAVAFLALLGREDQRGGA